MIVLSVFKRFVMFLSPLEEIHTHPPPKASSFGICHNERNVIMQMIENNSDNLQRLYSLSGVIVREGI